MKAFLINTTRAWKRCWLMALLALSSLAVQAQTRMVENLVDGWRFHAGDIMEAAQPAYDDSGWRTVALPHDFQIEQPWVAPDAVRKPTTPMLLPTSEVAFRAVDSKRWGRGGIAITSGPMPV